jgi:transcription-repair coupling factor (superfamily II helicase)
MLKRAVDALGGKTRFSRAECAVRLDFVRTEENAAPAANGLVDACIPAAFIPDALVRIACYRELAEAEDHTAVDAMESRWRDRFGPLPDQVVHLALLTRISIAGAARRFRSIEARDSRLMIEQKSGFVQVGGKFPRLTENQPASRLREVLQIVEQMPAR